MKQKTKQSCKNCCFADNCSILIHSYLHGGEKPKGCQYWKPTKKAVDIRESITKQVYDEESEFYDERRFTTPLGRYINEVEQKMIIQQLKGGDALELCCGTARFTRPIIEKGIKYYGIDFSERMIKKAKGKNKNNDAKFKILNVNHLSRLPKESFDNIFVARALKFWSNPQQVIDDSYNLLRGGGRLIIQFMNRNFLPHRILYFTSNTLKLRKYQNKIKMLRAQGVGTEKKYFISEVREMMKKAGFNIIYQRNYFNFLIYSIFDSEFFVKIARKLDNRFNFGHRAIIVGLK